MKRIHKQGAIWISAVLYLLISVLIMVIILQIGVPVIESMQDRSVVQDTQNQFQQLDTMIQTVARQEVGSRRTLPLELQEGEAVFNEDQMTWYMEHDRELLDQDVILSRGNMVVSGGMDVSAYEYNDSYILENSFIRINFSKCDHTNNCTELGEIINSVQSVRDESLVADNDYQVYIGDTTLFEGPGHSRLVTKGNTLAEGILEYHLDDPSVVLTFRLISYTDYVDARLTWE